MDYIAIIHKDEGSDYGVSFPDFDGLITAGSNVDEAKDMAVEALALHAEGMLEDGESLPTPTPLSRIMQHPDFADGVAFLVAYKAPAKTVRVNITLDEEDLALIDAAAQARGATRSGFLVQAGLNAAG